MQDMPGAPRPRTRCHSPARRLTCISPRPGLVWRDCERDDDGEDHDVDDQCPHNAHFHRRSEPFYRGPLRDLMNFRRQAVSHVSRPQRRNGCNPVARLTRVAPGVLRVSANQRSRSVPAPGGHTTAGATISQGPHPPRQAARSRTQKPPSTDRGRQPARRRIRRRSPAAGIPIPPARPP
jgi:hypothetical protein